MPILEKKKKKNDLSFDDLAGPEKKNGDPATQLEKQVTKSCNYGHKISKRLHKQFMATTKVTHLRSN